MVSGSLVGGTRTAWYDSRFAAASADIAAADAVSIMLGTNDCDKWSERSKYFKQEYKKLVAAIREINPDVTIYMMTSPAAYVGTHYDVLPKEIVPTQLELAAELGLKVVDVYNVTRDLMRDGNASGETGAAAFMTYFEANGYCRVHPDAEGASYIAKALFDAMTAPTAHVSELKSSATANTDATLTDGKNGANGIAPDANRVTTVGHNLAAAEGSKVLNYQAEGGKCYLVDGKLRFVNHTADVDHNNGCDDLVIDFGAPTAITQFLLGNTQVGANKADFLAPNIKVYITEDLDNLGNAVWSITDGTGDDDATVAGRIITLPEAVTGRYLVVNPELKQTSGTKGAWLSEVAAVGYRAEAADALGAQVREDDNALRFGFDLAADGVAYADADPVASNNYARDLTNATIVLAGKEYTLVDFGAVLSLDENSALTLDAADADTTGTTKAVPAINLYGVADGKVTYTAVVTGIPEAHFATPVYARSYATYSDGANTYTIYGEALSRTVSGCAGDALG